MRVGNTCLPAWMSVCIDAYVYVCLTICLPDAYTHLKFAGVLLWSVVE